MERFPPWGKILTHDYYVSGMYDLPINLIEFSPIFLQQKMFIFLWFSSPEIHQNS